MHVDGDVGAGGNQFRRMVRTEIGRRPARLVALFDQRRPGTLPEQQAENARERGPAWLTSGAPGTTAGARRGGRRASARALRRPDLVALRVALDRSWQHRGEV